MAPPSGKYLSHLIPFGWHPLFPGYSSRKENDRTLRTAKMAAKIRAFACSVWFRCRLMHALMGS
jgi:hypothetical protein